MKRVDHHSHIIHAGIGEMIEAAKRNNVSDYSITEHVSQFRELRESIRFGSVHTSGRMFESLSEYKREFESIGEDLGFGIRINRGLEVDYSPRYETRVGDFVNQEEWEILLCSVHEFEDGRDIEREHKRYNKSAPEREPWHDYFRLQLMALQSDFVPFTVLAHPVRMSKGVKDLPPDIDQLLLGLAETAKRKNKALELNGNDIDSDPELVRRLALACANAGCKVSLGSDAHYPRDVFRNVEAALALVQEYGLSMGT